MTSVTIRMAKCLSFPWFLLSLKSLWNYCTVRFRSLNISFVEKSYQKGSSVTVTLSLCNITPVTLVFPHFLHRHEHYTVNAQQIFSWVNCARVSYFHIYRISLCICATHVCVCVIVLVYPLFISKRCT